MPTKHQSNSFRIRKGVAYRCYGDYFGEVMDSGDHRAEAKIVVRGLRDLGWKAFVEHHPDEYSRVFIQADGPHLGALHDLTECKISRRLRKSKILTGSKCKLFVGGKEILTAIDVSIDSESDLDK